MNKKKDKDLDIIDAEEIESSSEENVLNEDELKMIEASRSDFDRNTLPAYDNSDFAKAKRFAKKNKFTVLFVTFTAILLVTIITLLVVMIIKSNEGKPSTDDFSITLGDNKPYTIRYKDAVSDGVFYFDVRSIAKYAGLTVTGGTDNLKLWCPDGTYVRFENGSETATVNGIRVFVGGTTTITPEKKEVEGKCIVPFSFVQKLFSYEVVKGYPGLKIVFNEDDNTIVMRKILYQETQNYLPISFSADCFDLAEDAQLKYYESKNPDLISACKKMTLLVNKSNPLGEEYEPEGLLSLNNLGCQTVEEERIYYLEQNAAHSLLAMMNALNDAVGNEETILVTSAYRSYNTQTALFKQYVDKLITSGLSYNEAISQVTATSAYPGDSEHQSGLCVDLIEDGKLELDESFAETAAFKWLSENAYKYGYILRYPKDKIDLTGYDYEPWHYRFVGIDAATVIFEDKICLEEYLAKSNKKI